MFILFKYILFFIGDISLDKDFNRVVFLVLLFFKRYSIFLFFIFIFILFIIILLLYFIFKLLVFNMFKFYFFFLLIILL